MTRRESFHIWLTYDILRGVILSLTAKYEPAFCHICKRIGKHTDFSFCSAVGGSRCCQDCFRPMLSDMTVNTYCGNPHTYDDSTQWGLRYAVDYKQGHPEEYQMYPEGASATF